MLPERIVLRAGFAIFAWTMFFTTAAPAKMLVTIGSKKFTESYVLAEIAKTQLERAGFEVRHREGIGGTLLLWQALLSGDISVYPEYTGTLEQEILKNPNAGEPALREALKKLGIGMSGGLGFEDGYALVMRSDVAARLGIRSISDLKRYSHLRAGPTPEFIGRQDGWDPLLAAYGLKFDSVRAIEHGLGYEALANDLISIKDCYSTDPKIAKLNLVTLEDDRHFFVPYRAVYLYRLDTPPPAVSALRSLEGKIGTDRMIALNRIAEESKNYALAASVFFGNGTETLPLEARRQKSRFDEILRLTLQHLTLVGVSLVAAIAVSIPLGIMASWPGIAGEIILGGAGIIQTIPSLALLALMIPVFGIGQPPAMVALFLYSLLPIVSGTATGLRGISVSLKQAGTALGLTQAQRLWLIDLPVALPSVLAGIRTSAVINVGTATLAGLVGGGGYGEPIQSGLQLNDTETILMGAIPAAILALIVQALFYAIEPVLIPKGLRPRTTGIRRDGPAL